MVVLAGGDGESPSFLRAHVGPDDLLVAANGGSLLALQAGLRPHVIIGDLDSVSAVDLRTLGQDVVVIRHPAEKDASDLELALDLAFEVEPPEVVVMGALGGRADHFLVNVGLLHRALSRGVPTRLVGASVDIRLVERLTHLDLALGSTVSLVPLTPRVDGVCLHGFRYPLDGADLQWGTSRCLSNVVVARPASVSLASGILLLVALSCEVGGAEGATAP